MATAKEGLDPNRFTAYKINCATQDRYEFNCGLTLEEVRDKVRFPLGPQHDARGKFVWSYGINNGQKII